MHAAVRSALHSRFYSCMRLAALGFYVWSSMLLVCIMMAELLLVNLPFTICVALLPLS